MIEEEECCYYWIELNGIDNCGRVKKRRSRDDEFSNVLGICDLRFTASVSHFLYFVFLSFYESRKTSNLV